MTIIDALNSEVGNITLANKILIQQGLNPDEDFTTENNLSIEIAKAYCFRAMVSQPDFSEDGLSITLNRTQMITEANRIFKANGLESEMILLTPTIKSHKLW